VGNDTLDGGAGRDGAWLALLSTEATWEHSGSSWTVTSTLGVNTLTGIERLVFDDVTVALDLPSSDLTGDGTSDILWQNSATNAVGMQVMDSGSAVWQGIGNGGSSWTLADWRLQR
jgi:hypothetical protein